MSYTGASLDQAHREAESGTVSFLDYTIRLLQAEATHSQQKEDQGRLKKARLPITCDLINGNWTILNNEVRIVGGLFTGSPGQILSRFSWELPQTITGYVASQGSNMIGDVKSVNYYDGATVVQHHSADWGGFTIGSYINGDKNIEANPNNELFQHEYGHYLQSQEAGWTYLSNYAIPSGYNGLTCPNGNDLGYYEHMAYSVEQDANIRAKTHFKEAKWDYKSNPIFDSGNNPNFDRDYSIYRTNQGLIRTSWWKSALIMVLCM